jgi:7-cyano-7-deazaguanine synthase
MTKAVVLFSGGQDSTTCLLWAIKQYGKENVTAISFRYGQKYKVEIIQGIKIVKLFPGVVHKVFEIGGLLPKTALNGGEGDLNGSSEFDASLPASFVPGRNILFFTLAGVYAATIGAEVVVSGVCQTDYSGYPDCRSEFVIAMEMALNLGLYGEYQQKLSVAAPLMYLTKAETWKLAKDLGVVDGQPALEVVRELSMTDYNGSTVRNEWGMGELNNPASVLRQKGYMEAKERGWV